jgi:hypothetical protein
VLPELSPVVLTVALKLTVLPAVDGFGVAVRAVLVATLTAALTVCVSTLEVLVTKPVSPEYTAVIACVPIARLEVGKLALPETKFTVSNTMRPSRKSTLPPGMPVPDAGVTSAWKVTD